MLNIYRWLFPRKPLLPVSIKLIKLEPGEHLYILLYNRNQTSPRLMKAMLDSFPPGINARAVGVYDPTSDLTVLEIKKGL